MTTLRIGAVAGALVLGAGLLAASGASTPTETQPAAAAQPPQAQQAPEDGTIVHLFQWTWDSVAQECTDFLGPEGFTGVQVSPPQEHVVEEHSEGGNYPWWQDYQPVSYQLDNTRRGTVDDFQDMVDTCADNGVRIYVDAVINHMTGPESGTGSNGTEWSKYEYPDLYGDGEYGYGHDDFGPCFDEITDWDDREQIQECELVQLADLDTGSEYVQDRLVQYLNGLIGMGVAGFRVDATKHVQVEHVDAIFSQLDDVPGWGGQPHVYHEVIGDETIPYTDYTDHGQITNFDHHRALSHSFADGDIAGLTEMPDHGGLTSEEAVVFVDNHDSQRYEPILTYEDGDRYHLATAFLLAHPYGTPVVMSGYDFEGNIAEGPPSTGEEDGNPAGWITEEADCDNTSEWTCDHRNEAVAGMAEFRTATAGTGLEERYRDGESRVAFDRGEDGFAAFNATDSEWELDAETSLPDGDYPNAAGPGTVTVSDGQVQATVPADGAVALHTGD
ncbi:alpha-amylase [Nocardiopsis salina]|uniref:alpha-amylase n=1 Tax=Nocardiopsis salina TaxID=245836 RepID=UPI00034D0141|nr:alpha-amylase family protein [Nocardiopsis salina]